MHSSSSEADHDLDGVKVAVTGANGFLGSVLCRQLVERGASVRAMVRDTRRADGLGELEVEVCEGDVRASSSLRRLFANRDYVFHVAALFRQQGVSDDVFYDINVMGTENALQAAADEGVSRFVHCSTVGYIAIFQTRLPTKTRLSALPISIKKPNARARKKLQSGSGKRVSLAALFDRQ